MIQAFNEEGRCIIAGSWEIKDHKTCLLGILHVDVVTIAWAFGLRNLQVPGHIMPVTGMPYDHARNVVCMKALELGVDYCAFVDSDVIPPANSFIRLMSHGLPIVSGIYHRRSPPHGVPVIIKNGSWYVDHPKNKLFEADLVGAGCLVISREFLQTIPPIAPEIGRHWFDWRVDRQSVLPPGEGLSEDFSLCRHAIKNGFKIMIDPSVQCRHIGLGQAAYGSFTPAEVITNT